jgi:hypothetical protein
MRPDNPSEELSPGRLFIHDPLNDSMTGGPVYCRIRPDVGDLVEYEDIYHREHDSERIPPPWRVPIGHFTEATFGGWYEGNSPPPAMPVRERRGIPVPLDPRKIGGRPAGS